MSGLTFVAFEPRVDGFIAAAPLEQLDNLGARPEAVLQAASAVYGRAVAEMRAQLSAMAELKAQRQPITAQKCWELGDAILALVGRLTDMSLEVDGLYDHLTRDLGMKSKRLRTAITFRRHLPDKELIPASLRWSHCERGARKVAENLSRGIKENSRGLGL